MCNGHATTSPFPAPRIPRTHMIGCTLWLRGDPLTLDPADCTCPLCVAQWNALLDDGYCDCAVVHTAGEVTRNVCNACSGRIQ